jgi:hypothetical protein
VGRWDDLRHSQARRLGCPEAGAAGDPEAPAGERREAPSGEDPWAHREATADVAPRRVDEPPRGFRHLPPVELRERSVGPGWGEPRPAAERPEAARWGSTAAGPAGLPARAQDAGPERGQRRGALVRAPPQAGWAGSSRHGRLVGVLGRLAHRRCSRSGSSHLCQGPHIGRAPLGSSCRALGRARKAGSSAASALSAPW